MTDGCDNTHAIFIVVVVALVVNHSPLALSLDRFNDCEESIQTQKVRAIEARNGERVLGQHLRQILEDVRRVHVAVKVEVQLGQESRDPVEPHDDLQGEFLVLVRDLLLLGAHNLHQPVEEDLRLVLQMPPLTLEHHVGDPQRRGERPDPLRGQETDQIPRQIVLDQGEETLELVEVFGARFQSRGQEAEGDLDHEVLVVGVVWIDQGDEEAKQLADAGKAIRNQGATLVHHVRRGGESDA